MTAIKGLHLEGENCRSLNRHHQALRQPKDMVAHRWVASRRDQKGGEAVYCPLKRTCYSTAGVTVPLGNFYMLTLDSIIQRDPEIIAAQADRDLVMVSIATGYYYGLSDVAREIWDAIEQPKRVSDLVAELNASYDIDSSSCEEQTLSFLEALRGDGLLQVKDGPAD